MHTNDLIGLFNTYLVSRKHLGTTGGHLSPKHNPNSNSPPMSQDGQTRLVNYGQVHDAFVITITCLNSQMHTNGPKWANEHSFGI